MKTAVVMLHFGDKKTTKLSLKKLKSKIKDNPLYLLNNTKEGVDDLGQVIENTTLINNGKNLGFAKGVNKGIGEALKDKSVDSVLLLNNDLEITFGTIEMLRKTLFSEGKRGIISPVLKHGDGMFDWGGRFNKWTGNSPHQNFKQKPKRVIEVDHVAGAAMMIKRETIEKIGLFDERFFLYFEDIDYCLLARNEGYTIHIDPEVVASHMVSHSSSATKRTLFQWSSHLKFSLKHMLSGSVYPTSLLYNMVFYPLALLKSLPKK